MGGRPAVLTPRGLLGRHPPPDSGGKSTVDVAARRRARGASPVFGLVFTSLRYQLIAFKNSEEIQLFAKM